MIHLMRLTQVPRAGLSENTCFVNPYLIEQIVRTKYRNNDLDGMPNDNEIGEGTFIVPHSGRTVTVMESPDQVAQIREKCIRATEKEERERHG